MGNPLTIPIHEDSVVMGNHLPLVLIAGPCQIEGLEHALRHADALVRVCRELDVPLVYKSSFDKANRTRGDSPRGVGMDEGLAILSRVATTFGIPVTTDVHTPEQARYAAPEVDILQIPAMLARQTDLLEAAGRYGKVVNIKKGQGMAPEDMFHARAKARPASVLFTERGTTFGHHDLVVDMRGLPIMAESGVPVIFDATHSVQKPSANGGSSGGERRFVRPLARAAVAVGVAGVFIECHEDPASAPSDGPCMLNILDLPALLADLSRIDSVAKGLWD